MLDNKELINKVIIENLKEKLACVAGHASTMDVLTIEGAQVVNSGFASDTFNAAYGGEVTKDVVKSVVDYYAKLNYPFAWWFEQSQLPKDAEALLQEFGMAFDENNVSMICSLAEASRLPMPESPLTIKSCANATDFHIFGDLIANLFDPKDENVQAYYDHLSQLTWRDMSELDLFIGYVDHEPVSTATLFKTNVAGFYDISTKASVRRKGYGAQMLRHAMQRAFEQGFEYGILQASPDGLGIYRQAGFNDAGNFQVWNKS